jgi:Domain of unknown function (DUF6438)
MSGKPGALQLDFERVHPGTTDPLDPRWITPPFCPASLEREPLEPNISELAIERTPCYGLCSTYTLRLYADGTVSFDGQANVKHVGHRDGHIDPRRFARLALLAVDIGYFDLGDDYDCLVTDNPTVYTSIVRDGVRKTIRHYAPDVTGPPRLRAFEQILDEVEVEVAWRSDRGH